MNDVAHQRNPLENLRFGLSVLGRELLVTAMAAWRRREMRGTKKLLEREYAVLGKRMFELTKDRDPSGPLPQPDEQAELAMRRVEFLQAEVAYLESDLERMKCGARKDA